jgi:hypothetical protein
LNLVSCLLYLKDVIVKKIVKSLTKGTGDMGKKASARIKNKIKKLVARSIMQMERSLGHERRFKNTTRVAKKDR